MILSAKNAILLSILLMTLVSALSTVDNPPAAEPDPVATTTELPA